MVGWEGDFPDDGRPKGGQAREAVNVEPGDWRSGDGSPLGTTARKVRVAVHGGKASKGRNAPRGGRGCYRLGSQERRLAATPGGNVVNPRVGSALQHMRPGGEEQDGEAVQDREAGT
jgi:hypothetical protein